MNSRLAVVGAVGVLALGRPVLGSVLVDCSITARARFMGVSERSEGAPAGRAGLSFDGPSWSFSNSSGEPDEAFAGETGWFAEPAPGHDGLLPRVGDEWAMGMGMSMAQSTPGHGMVVGQSVLDLAFLNETRGASVYDIDLVIDWELTYRVDAIFADTAVLFASGEAISVSGVEITDLGGVWVQRQGAVEKTTVLGTSHAHLRVGRLEDGGWGDLARVRLSVTLQGYVSTIPAPGVIGLMGMCLLCARRRRR